MSRGKARFLAEDTVQSGTHHFDRDLILAVRKQRIRGWYRVKIKCSDGELHKVAFEAINETGLPLSFEVVCQSGQFRSYIYVADAIETLIVKIKGAVALHDFAIELRPVGWPEYIWKHAAHGFLRRPRKYLAYYSDPLDDFLVTFAFPQPPEALNSYRWWIDNREPDCVREHLAQRAEVTAEIAETAILMTVCDPQPRYLQKAIESVLRQTSPKWRLSISDDASVNPQIRDILHTASRNDSRISLSLREQRGGISAATNDAFKDTAAPLVTCLDHDDVLADYAIEASALYFAAHPDCGVLFSDEDKIDERDHRFAPYFKPREFSPELFHSYNYINHMTVHRSDTIRAVGGWRSAYDGAQDYDLTLRSLKKIGHRAFHHLALVLYHWRAIAGSAALDVSYKPYAIEKGRLALEDYLSGTIDAAVSITDNTMYRLRYALLDPAPMVSIIVPFRDRADLLRKCTSSLLEKTDYPNVEIILMDNGSIDPSTLELLADLRTHPAVRIIRDDEPFNYSRLNNKAAALARGDYLCLLNNDIETNDPGWLRDMIGYASQPGVGCVGAKLHYPSGTIQHAGVVLGMGGVAGHAFLHAQQKDAGYFGRLRVASNFSALTGACLMVKKSTFETVGGLDAIDLAIAFNDIDFCIRVQALGLRNVLTPFPALTHWESASRGAEDTPEKIARFNRECGVMLKRHGALLANDPCYSPHLTLANSDFSIRTQDESFLTEGYL